MTALRVGNKGDLSSALAALLAVADTSSVLTLRPSLSPPNLTIPGAYESPRHKYHRNADQKGRAFGKRIAKGRRRAKLAKGSRKRNRR